MSDQKGEPPQEKNSAGVEEFQTGLSKTEHELELLRDWIKRRFWNFSLSSTSFDGFTEGVCLLGGVDPVRSSWIPDTGEYGAKLLPGALDFYGFKSYPAHDDAWQLRETVQQHLDKITSIGFTGRVLVREAVEKCDRLGLFSPWLEIAANDLACADGIPNRLHSGEVANERRRKAASKGGKERAAKSAKTGFLAGSVHDEFEKLKQSGFKECKFSDGRPNSRAIAEKIYFEFSATEASELPAITTIAERVRAWLKKSAS